MEEIIDAVDPNIKLPVDFTPERLVSIMSEKYSRERDETRAIWINDEVSGFFEDLKKKRYMSSADVLLCHLYDGRGHIRSTLARGDEIIKKPYLTVFVASTEILPKFFDEIMIRQGFLNRFLYLYGEYEEWKPLRRTLSQDEVEEAKSLEEWLKALNQSSVIMLDFNAEAWKFYQEFERKIDEKIRSENLGLKEGYFGNYPDFLLKLACIHRISRMSIEEFENPPPITVVGVSDLKWAFDFLRKVDSSFDKVLEIMKRTFLEDRKHVSLEEEVLRLIKINGGAITRKDLLMKLHSRFGIKAEDLDRVITNLENLGEIEKDIVRRSSTARRPTIVYRLKIDNQ